MNDVSTKFSCPRNSSNARGTINEAASSRRMLQPIAEAPGSLCTRIFVGFLSTILMLASIAPGEVQAHSFKVGLLVPMSGGKSDAGRQALNGFLLATGERDAHRDQESDGHLGGLDVYMFEIDSNQDVKAVVAEIERLIGREKVDFVTDENSGA